MGRRCAFIIWPDRRLTGLVRVTFPVWIDPRSTLGGWRGMDQRRGHRRRAWARDGLLLDRLGRRFHARPAGVDRDRQSGIGAVCLYRRQSGDIGWPDLVGAPVGAGPAGRSPGRRVQHDLGGSDDFRDRRGAGALDGGIFSFLPIYGLRHGLDEGTAALALAASWPAMWYCKFPWG